MGIIATIRQRVEQRATLRDPVAEWLRDALTGGIRSDSGEPVNRNTALNLPGVVRAVSLISGDIAKTPLITYRVTSSGKERARNHPAFFLLNEQPNVFQSKPDFWRDVMTDALLGHGGYVLINRDQMGMPTELIRLMGERTQTIPLEEVYGTYSRAVQYHPGNGMEPIAFLAQDVITVRGLSWDGLDGYEFAQLGKQSVGGALATQKHSNKFFANNASAGVAITVPPGRSLNKEQIDNLRKQFDDVAVGLDNNYRTVILQQGSTAQPFTVDPRNSQLMEIREWSKSDIANLFNISASKLNAKEINTSHASLEQSDREYVGQTLDPWFRQIEYQARAKCLTETEYRSGTFTIEFLTEALIRSDTMTKVQAVSTALAGHPWYTVDEGRGFFNLNPLGGKFDELQVPTNNFGESEPEEEEEPQEQPMEDDERNRRAVLEKELRQMVERVSRDCRRAAKSGKSLFKWLELADGRHREIVVGNLTLPLALNGSPLSNVAPAVLPNAICDRILDDVKTRALECSDSAHTDVQLLQFVDESLDDYEAMAVDTLMHYCLEKS